MPEYNRKERARRTKRGSRDPDTEIGVPGFPDDEPITAPGPPLFPLDNPFGTESNTPNEISKENKTEGPPSNEAFASPNPNIEFQSAGPVWTDDSTARGQVEAEFSGVGSLEVGQGDNSQIFADILREVQSQSALLQIIFATLTDMQSNGITLRA